VAQVTESEPERGRARAILSIQLEDEVRIERQRAGGAAPGDPVRVERRIERALASLDELGARATFFAEGRLVAEVSRSWWPAIAAKHELGCQGLSRTIVGRLGPDQFAEDARRGREALEDAAAAPVVGYRAPEFSVDGCDPWFGEGLAAAGYRADASRRLATMPEGATGGRYPLEDSGDAVVEVPLPMLPANLPIAGQRVMFLGSAAVRMLPLPTLRVAFELAEQQGFVPQIVLQLGDLDPEGPDAYSSDIAPTMSWRRRIDQLWRSTGRRGVMSKLAQLGWRWSFDTISSVALV
jgi:peptidoglycan/xylan/chitin deacetylase (PgdA/CDA1 family)